MMDYLSTQFGFLRTPPIYTGTDFDVHELFMRQTPQKAESLQTSAGSVIYLIFGVLGQNVVQSFPEGVENISLIQVAPERSIDRSLEPEQAWSRLYRDPTVDPAHTGAKVNGAGVGDLSVSLDAIALEEEPDDDGDRISFLASRLGTILVFQLYRATLFQTAVEGMPRVQLTLDANAEAPGSGSRASLAEALHSWLDLDRTKGAEVLWVVPVPVAEDPDNPNEAERNQNLWQAQEVLWQTLGLPEFIHVAPFDSSCYSASQMHAKIAEHFDIGPDFVDLKWNQTIHNLVEEWKFLYMGNCNDQNPSTPDFRNAIGDNGRGILIGYTLPDGLRLVQLTKLEFT